MNNTHHTFTNENDDETETRRRIANNKKILAFSLVSIVKSNCNCKRSVVSITRFDPNPENRNIHNMALASEAARFLLGKGLIGQVNALG